ncbi:hypothetical protein PIB30_015644 [Stylosanthes scabra]|uniref:F-box domain-containing protein n=1 Tax=Stylosanthes scabra TaxID=79078 RepID=A0ABU6T6R9_9FABA|nr:hypothetical protein [Stylosanthes scabra]
MKRSPSRSSSSADYGSLLQATDHLPNFGEMAESSTATKRSMGTDFISNLPDSLLCHILSFLPTFDAVCTGFLSRRWRHLWKDHQVFDFTDKRIRGTERFESFVESVLSQRRCPDIQKFRLKCYSLDDLNALKRWIHAAVGPSLQEMELNFFNYQSRDAISEIFTCASLVSLSLVGYFYMNYIESFHLPMLKNLELAVPEVFVDSSKLISGCPALENLYFVYSGRSTRNYYNDMNLLCPSLKRLNLISGRDFRYSKISKIQIDAPNLEFLRIYLEDLCVTPLAVSDFPNMMEASFDISPKAEHVDWLPELLQALSMTKKLDLGALTTQCLVKAPNLHLPEFSCLSQLRICFKNFYSGVLMKLLCCCPMLQVLKIDNTGGQQPGFENPGSILTEPSSWTQPAIVPSCVMSDLNTLEFRRYPDSSEEREFFAYILQNALVLKTITIYTNVGSYEKEKEHILNEISALPRGSSLCQVEEFSYRKWG